MRLSLVSTIVSVSGFVYLIFFFFTVAVARGLKFMGASESGRRFKFGTCQWKTRN